jgi:transcription elongation GreA/GreB family factor
MLVEPERDERMVEEFARVLAQVDELQALLTAADDLRLDPTLHDGRAELGMRVHVRLQGEESWVRPVHPAEAFLDDERISAQSPLAIALMGARAGHTVWVDAPSGACPCEVLQVDPST